MRIDSDIFSCSRKTFNRSATTTFRSSDARGFYHGQSLPSLTYRDGEVGACSNLAHVTALHTQQQKRIEAN